MTLLIDDVRESMNVGFPQESFQMQLHCEK